MADTKKRGLLKYVFAAAAVGVIGAVATSYMTPPSQNLQYQPPQYAQQYPSTYPPSETGMLSTYRHPTLASDSTQPVGIQLVLAMDNSGSMSDEEYAVELQASAESINSQLVRSAIKYKTGLTSAAIAVLDFDSWAELRIGWVDIRGSEINDKPYKPGDPESSKAPDKLDQLAQEIVSLQRRSAGSTDVHSAVKLSKDLFLGCPWEAKERRILDVFGDGAANSGGDYDGNGGYMTPDKALEESRDELSLLGATINGFAIINEEPTLDQYYRDHLVTKSYIDGPGVLYSEPGRVWAVARNLQSTGNTETSLKAFFGEVRRGMKQKISIEIAGLGDYNKILAIAHEQSDFPLPQPVSDKKKDKAPAPSPRRP